MASRTHHSSTWRKEYHAKLQQIAADTSAPTDERVLALSHLGNLGEAADVEFLQTILSKSTDARLRQKAATCLRNMKGYHVNQMLIDALISDPIVEVLYAQHLL